MKRRTLISIGLGCLLLAGLVQADQTPSTVPLKLGKKRALLLPVKVADSVDAEFQLNTGLGFNLISPQLAQKLGMESTSPYKVRPVTGGELNLARGKLSTLSVGNQKENDLDVIIGEPKIFVGNDGETKVDGILSLAFFRNHPFTLDYPNQQIVLEDSQSLAKRKATGTRVECRFSDENNIASVLLVLAERAAAPPSPGGITGFLQNITGGGGAPEPPKAWVQVDTGCESLLLDSKLMFTLKIDATGTNITEADTTDQNGYRFRSFASQMGKVELAETSLSKQKAPVIFRKLLDQGVLGQDFLRHYTVTFDVANSELFFAKGN